MDALTVVVMMRGIGAISPPGHVTIALRVVGRRAMSSLPLTYPLIAPSVALCVSRVRLLPQPINTHTNIINKKNNMTN